MTIWTVSAQAGTRGRETAAELAARAGIPLLDRRELVRLAHDLDPEIREDDDLEARVGGRLSAFALALALTGGAPHAFHELHLRETLPRLARSVLEAAAREPAVILAPGAFAALRDHPSAVHVRLCAPFAWRVEAYRRDELVERSRAEKAVRHDDDQKRAWVRALYHLDLDDPRSFSLVVDVSRLPFERVVATLLAAGAARVPA